MKITLKKIELTNFGSWKHAVLSLEKRGAVLIQGRTGSGKSTLFKALFWVLYGALPDGGQADEVVNDHVGKNTAVSLQFRIGQDEYKLIRYRKHTEWKNKCVLWCNGEVLGEKDSKVDVINRLITRIIAIDADTFLKTVYFIQRDAQRFPALTDLEQKKLIEAITDLALLPMAERVTRDKLSQAQRMQVKLTERCQRYDESITSLERLIHSSRALDQAERQEAEVRLRDLTTQVTQCEDVLARREKEADLLKEQRDEVMRDINRDRHDYHRYAKQREFLEAGQPTCPTCGVALDAKQKHTLYMLLHQQQTLVEKSLDTLEAEIKALDTKVQALVPEELYTELEDLKTYKSVWERKLHELKEGQPTEAMQHELAAVSMRRAASLRVKATVERFVQRLEFWIKGFGRTGLRTLLLPQVLMQLTERTNYYLSAFDGAEVRVQYLLGEGRILQAYRTHGAAAWKSYASLSGGERQMVDLGTSLALREIADSHRAHSIDCLLLDEPLEGLDGQLAQQLPKLLSLLPKGSVFMIAHSDQLAPYFPHLLTVRKTSQISSFV
jgi:DNA repair exonuclease SbcCD ATPase subunit